MSGTDLSPIIKVVISPSGGVSFLGKRSNTSPLEVVYDTSNKCLKLYTSTDGGNSYAWYCVSNHSCPETSKTFVLDCSNASVTGDTFLDPNVNFTITLPYLDGDGSSYAQQLIPSTGTTGLTAILSAGTLANGSGNLALTVSGPSTSDNGGTYYFEVSINGKKTYMPQKRLFLLKWPLSYI